MDRFSFFFAFYGLILGLAVTELLSGFAGFARERRLRDLQLETALLAILVFADICATWIDAYQTLRGVTLNFAGLASPIMVATSFFLAAAIVFPRRTDELELLPDYYARRHGFVAVMLLVAEVFVSFTFMATYRDAFAHRPAVFWLFHLPYKLALIGLFAALALARTRRANLCALVALLFLFSVPYWTVGAIPRWIHQHLGTADGAVEARR